MKTNSGVSSLLRWLRKRGRHGAGPMLEGMWAVVDMVRLRQRRRLRGEEAMVGGCCVGGEGNGQMWGFETEYAIDSNRGMLALVLMLMCSSIDTRCTHLAYGT